MHLKKDIFSTDHELKGGDDFNSGIWSAGHNKGWWDSVFMYLVQQLQSE